MNDFVPDLNAASNPDNHSVGRIRLIEGDITQQYDIEAIVTAIPVTLDMGGSLNKSIVQAAGQELDDFILENIYKPRIGDVHALPGFDMRVRHIIVAITPVWGDGTSGEDRDLLRCYRSVFELAERLNLNSMALPALGTGNKSFPVQRAARLALQAARERFPAGLQELRIVCNRKDSYESFAERLKGR